MRITNAMITDANAKYMKDSLESINKAQKQVNSQKLFDNPSDDPLAASFSLSLKSTLTTLTAFQTTAASADNWMGATDYAFQNLNDIALSANNLVLNGLNDTVAAPERLSMSQELDGMLSQALEAANATQDGQYLFAGHKTNIKPFSLVNHALPGDTNPTYNDPLTGSYEIVYSGDGGQMQRAINVGQSVTQNVAGNAAPFKEYLTSLVAAREALKTNQTTNLRTALGGMQTASTALSDAQGASASRWRQVLTTSDFLSRSSQATSTLISQNEDINLAEGITTLRKQESNYQVVMEVTSRAISAMTLFDYLK